MKYDGFTIRYRVNLVTDLAREWAEHSFAVILTATDGLMKEKLGLYKYSVFIFLPEANILFYLFICLFWFRWICYLLL